MRALTIILGILLIITGIYCFFNLGMAFVTLALFLGIVMMVYGISQIIAWFASRKNGGSSGWVAFEGILTLAIGAIVAFYPLSEVVLAIWFAAWLIASGLMRIIAAVQTKRNFPGTPWGFMMFMGILTIVVGIYGVIHPMVIGMALAMLFGIFFVLQGINCILFGLGTAKAKDKK